MMFQEKCFSGYNFFTNQFLLIDCIYLLNNWKMRVMYLRASQAVCNVFACFSGCDLLNFEINPSFIIRTFSYMAKKVGIKTGISYKQK